MVTFVNCPAGQGKRITSRTRFGQSIRTHNVLCEAGQICALLLIVAPSHNGVVYKRVLNIDENAERGVYARDLLDRKNRHKETACGASELPRNMNSH